jgi:hypothetical protein
MPEHATTPLDDRLKMVATWATYLLPVAFAVGSRTTDVMCVVIGGIFLAHCITRRDFSWLQQDWLKLLALLWVYTVARALFAELPSQAIPAALAWSRFLLLAAALGTWVLNEEIARHRMLLSVAAVTAFLSSDAIFQYIVGFDVFGIPYFSSNSEIGTRLTASIGKIYVGALISWIFLPAVLGVYGLNQRAASAVLAVICLIATLLSGERMAFLAVFVGRYHS